MASITFQPVLRDIKDVLKSDFYSIPRFQRPYSWSSENLDDFWRDVVLDNDEGYFIGPMVAYGAGGDAFGIVDGQQRMTSITLALCVIRDKFQQMQATAFSNGLAKYIEREDDDSVSHYVLRSDAAGDFLKSQIQAPLPRSYKDAGNDEERSLRKAFDDISAWLNKTVEGLSDQHVDGPEASDAAQKLREIRDKILALQVIWIVLDSVDDAYVIFETLNSRGKDLETVDLLKNLLLQAIKAENGDLDTARLKWNEMRQILSDQGAGTNPNKFILHWWLSQKDYTAERKLFRLMKRQFKKDQANDWLISLREDAMLYSRLAAPQRWQCQKFETPLQRSLLALGIFGVRQPRPVLLALMKAYRDGVIKFGRLRTAVRAIESYHYISTAVVGVSSTGGISMMYAFHAREISAATAANNAAGVHASIDVLVAKLHGGVSSRATFLSEFDKALQYSSERPEARRLVQYTLSAIHDYAVSGTAIDHSRCNIEHVGPQADPQPWTASIGNLLWVDEELNAELGSLAFDQKKPILAKRSQSYDFSDVLSATEWTGSEVEERAHRLAELAYDKVWRIT
ncbi:MAG: GmrSD restriction endonuclease domain-containing protein [Nocardioides sp.]